MTSTEQAALAEELKIGSEKAKQVLFIRCYAAFLKTAETILKNKEDAEDVLSESLDKIFKKIYQLDDGSKLLGWCHRIIRNKAFDYIKNRQITSDFSVYEPAYIPSFSTSTDLEVIQEAIETLPPGYKKILKLYCYEGKSYEEIQNLLQINPGTVKSQIWKGRRLLRKKLNFEY